MNHRLIDRTSAWGPIPLRDGTRDDRDMTSTRMTWKTTTLGILAAVAIAAPMSISCEEDDPGEVDADVAPGTVASAVCSRYFACACEMIDDGRSFSSKEACELALAQDLQEAIDEGEAEGLTYNGRCPALQADLADGIACRSIGELALDLQLLARYQDYDTCKLFYGERGPGQSCDRLAHSNGDTCTIDLVCSNDICITREDQLGRGEECEPALNECDAGLVCVDVDGGQPSFTCETLPRSGQTCLGTANICDIDFTCEIASKTCVALPRVGSPCAEMPSVLQWRCERGAICDEDSDTCIAAPGGGEPCTDVCQEGFSCQAGRCAEDPALICAVDVAAGS